MLWRSIVAAIVAVGFRETLSDGMIRFRPHHHVILPDPSVIVHVCQFREREVHDRHGVSVAAIRSPVKRCGVIGVLWITKFRSCINHASPSEPGRDPWHAICKRAVGLLGIQKIVDKQIDILFALVLVIIPEKVKGAKFTNFTVTTADKSSDQVPPVHVNVLDIVSEDGWFQHRNNLSAIRSPVKRRGEIKVTRITKLSFA
jgi:hypothetical protein